MVTIRVPTSGRQPIHGREPSLVHHHARECADASPLAPVRAAAWGAAPHAPACLQGQPHPIVAALAVVLGGPASRGSAWAGEVPVAGCRNSASTRATSSTGARRAEDPAQAAGRRGPLRTVGLKAIAASAGRCAPTCPAPPPPRPDSAHRARCARKTSSKLHQSQSPVPAPSDASKPSMAWKPSKSGQIIWYTDRTYPVLPTVQSADSRHPVDAVVESGERPRSWKIRSPSRLPQSTRRSDPPLRPHDRQVSRSRNALPKAGFSSPMPTAVTYRRGCGRLGRPFTDWLPSGYAAETIAHGRTRKHIVRLVRSSRSPAEGLVASGTMRMRVDRHTTSTVAMLSQRHRERLTGWLRRVGSRLLSFLAATRACSH